MERTIKINDGTITQSYKFIRQIGRGSSGICFLAEFKQKPLILKCIKQIKKCKQTNKIPNQAYFMDILCHPDIIRLYEIFQDEKNYYFVIDYCEGGDLFDYLQKYGSQSESQAKNIFIQMISAIKYCHSMKISHRDIKPENFLLLNHISTKSCVPNIKLIDFDLSFQWDKNMQQEVIEQEGTRIKGTPYYISPQILQGKYDEKCDIWSIGVLLHILLTGAPPFEGQTQKQIFSKIKSGKLNFESNQYRQLGLLVKDLLKKMLSPVDKRITIDGIMNHPWMKIQAKKTKINVDFSHLIRFSKFCKLKQIAATYLASQMTAKETESISTLFKILDKNKDGFISSQQIKEGVTNLPIDEKVKDQMSSLLKFVDSTDVCIDYNQFIAVFIKQKSINSQKNLLKVFAMMDYDKNGLIDQAQLQSILLKMGAKKKPFKQIKVNEDSDKIFAAADKNNDGVIDFSEFKHTIICNFD